MDLELKSKDGTLMTLKEIRNTFNMKSLVGPYREGTPALSGDKLYEEEWLEFAVYGLNENKYKVHKFILPENLCKNREERQKVLNFLRK